MTHRIPLKRIMSVLTVTGIVAAAAFAVAWSTDLANASPRSHMSDRDLDFSSSWNLSPGQTIEIKGVNGSVHAIATDGAKVEVTATKHWKKSDPDQVKIEVIESGDGVTVCAVYPGRFGERNSCEAGEHWSSHTHNNDVSVEFEVRVPAGIRFSANTVNGDVEANALTGEVNARTVNGSVRLSTEGIARAATVNGSIVATIGRARWHDELEFATVNGGITIEAPKNLAARFSAQTVNGDIDSDFPITVRGRVNRHHLEGEVGTGGGSLTMATVNGSIRLRSSQ